MLGMEAWGVKESAARDGDGECGHAAWGWATLHCSLVGSVGDAARVARQWHKLKLIVRTAEADRTHC